MLKQVNSYQPPPAQTASAQPKNKITTHPMNHPVQQVSSPKVGLKGTPVANAGEVLSPKQNDQIAELQNKARQYFNRILHRLFPLVRLGIAMPCHRIGHCHPPKIHPPYHFIANPSMNPFPFQPNPVASEPALMEPTPPSTSPETEVEIPQEPIEAENPKVAAGEDGRIWGDPHFEGGDGGKYDVQGEAGKTYNILNDTFFDFNARFAPHSNPGKTVVGESGITLRSPEGDKETQIAVRAQPEARVVVDGVEMEPGQTIETADGGRVYFNLAGNEVRIITREGYVIEQQIKRPGPHGELDIRLRTGENGVNNDGRLPGGLLGQTFDPGSIARNSDDSQGVGAIEGSYKDYEVVGGVFGSASPEVLTN